MILEKHPLLLAGDMKVAVMSIKSVLVVLMKSEARAEKTNRNELYRHLFLGLWANQILSQGK